MPSFDEMLTGFRAFKATTYESCRAQIEHVLRQGLKPTTLFVTSCGLRIAPDTIVSADPGELFVVRNLGGLVPPYNDNHANGTVAAIEYAVSVLEVQNVIVLGHAHCEGIHALMSPLMKSKEKSHKTVQHWLNVARTAKEAVLKQLPEKSDAEQQRACEQEAVLVSVKNLLEYPAVKKRLKDVQPIDIYGWFFNIETGKLRAFDPRTKCFEEIG